VALRLSLSFDPPNFFKRIGFSPLQRMEGVQFRTAITGNGLTLAATKAAASEATEAATAAPRRVVGTWAHCRPQPFMCCGCLRCT
jgi:hypothetical protein